MILTRLRAAVLLALVATVTGFGQQSSPSNRPWPPGVQKVSSESPPLSAEDALNTFYMPPGYRLELVASEPLIQEPVAIDWDTDGRLWAVEMPGFMANITASNEHDPIGRVVVLEDTDGDGRMDKRTVFADGLVLARSLKILDRGVLVAEPPNVWLMHDTNGDLRMDTKELITNQYGRRDADPQNNANGFHWALDNRMYTAGTADIQLRLKNGTFEVEKTLQRGEWGIAEDDSGNIYRNTNESAVHVDFVPTLYFARNPNLVRTRGSYERLADANYELNTVWPVRPNPGTNRAYQIGIDRADGTLARFTSVCAPVVYRGDRLPADVYGSVFVAEPAANLVSRITLEDDGTSLRARKSYDRGEFLASTDERFRPVFLSNAPDGTLYVVDMYRGIIEHRISITMYLRDQILERRLDQPTGFGRIYRVMHETTKRDTAKTLSKGTSEELVQTLSHPNGWWRDTAQRLLVERRGHPRRVDAGSPATADETTRAALVGLVPNAADARIRARALWTLDGIDAIEPATVIRALEDASPDVRRSAVRIAERWLGEAGHPIHAAILKRLDDENWAVRKQLAASLGALPAGQREDAIVALLDRRADDPVVMDAALSGVRGTEPMVLEKLLAAGGSRDGANQTPQRELAITMTAATIVRSSQDRPIQDLLDRIANDRLAMWQRAALLRGTEVAVLGATPPGTPTAQAAPSPATALPCPTCPGGRAGPGGAYAFTRSDTPVASSAGRGRAGGPSLRLSAAPGTFTAFASQSGELNTRASKLLARVSWPGKPGETGAVRPLTTEEQARFNAGREIYRNVCQACHQPDGRGQDKVAPSLVGSAMALAAAEIPARILLNGKEGAIGLMPPIGSAFSDEQLASVLTYIRREWSQTGTPVDSRAVTSVRAATGGRTRPWTDAELMQLDAWRK
jgi:putative membrane-bound dehydrogenase-like protein